MSSKWKASSPIQNATRGVEAVSLLCSRTDPATKVSCSVTSQVKRHTMFFWGRRDKGMRNRDTETDICSERCLRVWKCEPHNKSRNQVHHHGKPVRDSIQTAMLQNSTLHNCWFGHVPCCWSGHVPTVHHGFHWGCCCLMHTGTLSTSTRQCSGQVEWNGVARGTVNYDWTWNSTGMSGKKENPNFFLKNPKILVQSIWKLAWTISIPINFSI